MLRKSLNIYLNNLFKFNDHARTVLGKAVGRFHSLLPVLRSSYLNKKIKLLIYKVAIRPMILYGVPIWFPISPSVASKLEMFERKVLRLCVNKNFRSYNRRFSNDSI